MTEQQQKLLQEAKDAVAKENGFESFEKLAGKNIRIDNIYDEVAIKYQQLCEADKSTELQSLILTRSGSIHHSFVDINEQLNECLKGANIIPKHTFTNYDSNSQVASLTLFYTQPPK